MAFNIAQSNLFLEKLVRNTYNYVLGGVRNKGIGVRRKRRPKHYGPKVLDGCVVKKATILSSNFHLRFCPGLNVGFMNGHLHAKVAGKVYITSELSNFDESNPKVQRYNLRSPVMFFKYYNVIPAPQHCRFKLIDNN